MLARHARRMREDARGVAKLNAASNVTPPVGYVYVIVNEGMPGLVKVGYSSRRPGKRAEELSSTGNPYRYKVAFYLSSANPYEVEQLAHEYLRKFSVGEEQQVSVLSGSAVRSRWPLKPSRKPLRAQGARPKALKDGFN